MSIDVWIYFFSEEALVSPNPSPNPRFFPHGGLTKRRVPPCFSAKVDSTETSSSESSIISKFSLIRDGVTDLGRTTILRATIQVSSLKIGLMDAVPCQEINI